MGSKLLTCCAPRRNSDADDITQISSDIKSAPTYENLVTNYSTNQTTCENTQTRNTEFSFSNPNYNKEYFCEKYNKLPFSKTMKTFVKKSYTRDFEEEYAWNDFQEHKKLFPPTQTLKNFSVTFFSKNKKIFKHNEENLRTHEFKIHINNDINKHFRLKRRYYDDVEC
jgi:hypothetical protein